jgi:hypothetical protein
MRTKYIFVHGMAQSKKGSASLLEEWMKALRAGLKRAGLPCSPDFRERCSLPFYGAQLAKVVNARINDGEEDDVQRGSSDLEELIKCYERQAQNMPRRKKETRTQTRVDPDEMPRGGRRSLRKSYNPEEFERKLPKAIRQTLAVVDNLVPNVAQMVVEATPFLREVAAYLQNRKARTEIDEMLRSEIETTQSKADNILIVSHSLGTVVSYSVLQHLLKDQFSGVPVHWITLGSPLGILGVQAIMKERCKLDFNWPAPVQSWMNASDERDVVALARRLDRETFFRGSKQTRFDVVNFTDIENETFNSHGISGYLSDPVVAHWLVSRETQ